MYFLTLIVKNLLRRPGRSLLTITGLAIGVGAVVSLVGVAAAFEDSFLTHYSERRIDLIVQRAGTNDERLNRGLPEQLGPKLAKVPGVKEVFGRLLDTISFENTDITSVLIFGWPVDSKMFDRLTLLRGKRLTAGDKRKALVGRVLAANLGKHVGDEIELYAEPFEIVGVFESPTTFENGGVVVPLDEQQRMMNRPHEVTGFSIAAMQPIDAKGLEDLRRRVEALETGLEATPMADFISGIKEIRISRAVAWITSAIAVIIGGIGMLNSMIMSVSERTKEIGMLRAIGWRRSRVIRMVLGESLLLSVAGACVGCFAGAGVAKIVCLFPNVSGWIEGSITASVVLQGFLVALLVGGVGGLFPAMWSANLSPTEALRR